MQQVANLTQNMARVLQYIKNQEHRANPNSPPYEEEGLQNDLHDTLQDNNNSSQRVHQKSNPTRSARRVETHASHTDHPKDLRHMLETKQDLRHKLNSKHQYKKHKSEGSSASTRSVSLKVELKKLKK